MELRGVRSSCETLARNAAPSAPLPLPPADVQRLVDHVGSQHCRVFGTVVSHQMVSPDCFEDIEEADVAGEERGRVHTRSPRPAPWTTPNCCHEIMSWNRACAERPGVQST